MKEFANFKKSENANQKCNGFINVFNFDQKTTVRHFFLKSISRRNTSRILDRYEERGSIEQKKNMGKTNCRK